MKQFVVKYVALHHVSTAKGQKTRESPMTDNVTQSHLLMTTFLTQAATSFQKKQIKSYLLSYAQILYSLFLDYVNFIRRSAATQKYLKCRITN